VFKSRTTTELKSAKQDNLAAMVGGSNGTWASVGISEHGNTLPDEPCHRCKKMVCMTDENNPHVNATGKYFHGPCFCCKECGVPLQMGGWAAYLVNGDYVCKNHSQTSSCSCSKCDKPIFSQRVEAFNCNFHPECFKCKQCGTGLADKPFRSKMTDAYCMADFKALFPEDAGAIDKSEANKPDCDHCGKKIQTEYLESERKKFHMDNCFEAWKETRPSVDAKTCAACGQAASSWIEAAGKCYHNSCFKCKQCDTTLTAAFAKKGNVFCKKSCYQKFALL
jgi:hypothetical protein